MSLLQVIYSLSVINSIQLLDVVNAVHSLLFERLEKQKDQDMEVLAVLHRILVRDLDLDPPPSCDI